MVFFEDKGTLINAPLETVWEYFHADAHDEAHRGSLRNVSVKSLSSWTMEVTAERCYRGAWSKFVTDTTFCKPLAIFNEEIEGLFAGSKFIMLYAPHGRQTRVDVMGDLRSPTLPDSEVKRVFEEMLETSYEEDTRVVEQFAAVKRA